MSIPTQQEYNVTKQRDRKLYAKFSLLNYSLQMVDELSGVIIGMPTFSNNAQSDIRRTINISLHPTNSSFDIKEGNKIWLDKYIRVYIGIRDIHTKEIIYTNMGVYMVNNPSRTYNAESNIMTIDGLDLMAKLTGLRNGNLEGMEHRVEQGANVRNAIISTLAIAGFTNYVVDECPITVPNQINISVGGTVYDILKELRDILPQYQMYFDVDGVFHYNLIPSGTNEQVAIDDDIFKATLTEYSIDTDFEGIKNEIVVIGKTHDISYYGIMAISSNAGTITIVDASLSNNLKIGFNTSTNGLLSTINLNAFGAKQLLDEYGNSVTLTDVTDKYYVAKYQSNGDYWLYMGEVTPIGIAQETNPDSPFYIGGDLGVIREVLSGGEYDNIYTSNLALQRARWELYNSCRIADNITITCVPIYWADVNTVIEVTLPNKQGTEEKNKYIIKQISIADTQLITAMRYYAYYG